MKSTFKDERQMESSLFSITGMITWIFQDLSLASKVNPLACKTSAQFYSDFSDWFSASGRWMHWIHVLTVI